MLDMTSATTSRRTVTHAASFGIAQSLRHVRLVLLVWFVFLTLAWVAALPAWRWFSGVLSYAPEGDRLLAGLNVALLRELTHYDRSPMIAVAMGSSFAFFLIALVLNPFVAGGTLGALTSRTADIPSPRESGERDTTPTRSIRASGAPARVRGVTRRFVDAGVHWYWRFARILLLVGMLGAGLTMVLAAGFEGIGAVFDDRGMAVASMWTENLMLLMWLVVFGVCSLIIDIARIFLIRRDDGRAIAAVKQSLRFLWRNTGAVVVVGVMFGLMVAAAIAIYNLVASGITPLSWGLIAFTIIWQQLFALTRTTLRVGLVAAFVELVDAREPLPIEPAQAVTAAPVDEPVYELPMLG